MGFEPLRLRPVPGNLQSKAPTNCVAADCQPGASTVIVSLISEAESHSELRGARQASAGWNGRAHSREATESGSAVDAPQNPVAGAGEQTAVAAHTQPAARIAVGIGRHCGHR